jgi:hypothetical protein
MSTSNGNESTWKSPFCYENMFLYPNPVLQPRFIFLPLSLSPIKKQTKQKKIEFSFPKKRQCKCSRRLLTLTTCASHSL